MNEFELLPGALAGFMKATQDTRYGRALYICKQLMRRYGIGLKEAYEYRTAIRALHHRSP